MPWSCREGKILIFASLFHYIFIFFSFVIFHLMYLQFLSDLVHVLEDFKASEGGKDQGKLEA